MSVANAVTIADLLRDRAAERPDTVAVHFPDPVRAGVPPRWTAVTFGEIHQRADDYARGFTAAGLRPGDRTLLMAKPSPDFYAMVFGLVRAGAVPVFIDPGMGLKNALACVERIAPRAMIAIPPVHAVSMVYRRPFRSVDVAIVAGASWLFGRTTLAGCVRPGTAPFQPPEVSPDDDAVIVFTSGSTGPAKGVSMTHRCMAARVAYIQEMFDLTPGTLISETLLVYTVLEMCMGLTVVIPPMDLAKPAAVDPDTVLHTLRQFEPSVGSASPVVWHRVVRRALETGQTVPGVRALLTTAAPIPVDLHQRMRTVFPGGAELYTPYGATEAMPIARIGTDEILADTAARTAKGAGTCVGRLAPGIEVRIIGLTEDPLPTWADVTELPEHEIGEIVVRGDGVSRAYRNAPEGNAAAKIADGDTVWHRMGDLGYLDDDNRLWFCGRVGHRLETADGMVPAVCVEGIVNRHPAVYRSALVGVGQAGREVPVMVVELEPGQTGDDALSDELRALTRDTPYEGLFDRVLYHPRFPTDARHNSKIRREDLRPWVAAHCPDLARH